jgi:hypothetical protein
MSTRIENRESLDGWLSLIVREILAWNQGNENDIVSLAVSFAEEKFSVRGCVYRLSGIQIRFISRRFSDIAVRQLEMCRV